MTREWQVGNGRKCNALQPGHVDFPARCELKPGHPGAHATKPYYLPPYSAIEGKVEGEEWE